MRRAGSPSIVTTRKTFFGSLFSPTGSRPPAGGPRQVSQPVRSLPLNSDTQPGSAARVAAAPSKAATVRRNNEDRWGMKAVSGESEPRTERVFERSKRREGRLLRCAACAAHGAALRARLTGLILPDRHFN